MKARALAGIAAFGILIGCASVNRPSYCDALESSYRNRMNQMPDKDVAWLSTAFSRTQYGGQCACPNDVDGDGNRCGDRSAYSRPGGANVIHCSPEDVPQELLPAIRDLAVWNSLPYECGGEGRPQILDFGR